MSFFSLGEKKVFFVTKNFSQIVDYRCDIVLSPEFYWVKKVRLNIKFSHIVKKMAPSIFDGMLPDGEFEYRVFKVKTGEFIVLAYDIKEIMRELELLGINLSMIDKMYTVQSELLEKDIEIAIDSDSALAMEDDVLFCMPVKLAETNNLISIDDVMQAKRLSSNYIFSKSFQKVKINSKDIALILSLLILLNVAAMLDILKTKREIRNLEKQKEVFIKENSLPSTSFQLKAMKNELQKIYNPQVSFRKRLEYIGKFKLNKKENFNSIIFKKGMLQVVLKLDSAKREDEFKRYASSKMTIEKTYKKGRYFVLEVQI